MRKNNLIGKFEKIIEKGESERVEFKPSLSDLNKIFADAKNDAKKRMKMRKNNLVGKFEKRARK